MRYALVVQDQPAEAVPAAQSPETGRDALYCPQCMYDLRGIVSESCPECGFDLKRVDLENSSIPWVYRTWLTGWWALLRTAWRVSFKTDRFCLEVARPVSLPDARALRRWVVALLVLALLVVSPTFAILVDDLSGLVDRFDASSLILIVALYVLMFVPFLIGFTGLHTYWFHPWHLSVEQQNRAVALSYYACAPLVFGVLPIVLAPIGLVMIDEGDDIFSGDHWLVMAGAGVFFGGLLLGLFVFAAFMFSVLRMARQTAQRSGFGRLGMAGSLLVLWLVLALVCLVVLPGVLVYIYFVIRWF